MCQRRDDRVRRVEATMTEFNTLLSPLKIKNVTIRNRILSTAHSSGFAQDGLPQQLF